MEMLSPHGFIMMIIAYLYPGKETMPTILTSSKSPHRPTIGLITALLKGPTEINLWHGVADRSSERDVNLICFSGGIPNWPHGYESQHNILFNMASPQNVDGLVIWSNILSHTLDHEQIEQFCHNYAPLPVISMGMPLSTIPSIYIDMHGGMCSIMTHLIEKHACRRIAFIRGLEVSQDAEERYQAYLDTLSAYGIQCDPGLVQPGDFRRPSAYTATEFLIDHYGTHLDAIVSANDNMAIGVIQALQNHGIRVPEDILVVGFDDIEETLAISPSLTTVRTPWYEMGSKSVDMLLAKINGESLPKEIKLQTDLILGQSCGCLSLSTSPDQSSLWQGWIGESIELHPIVPDQEGVRFGLLAEMHRKVILTDAAQGLEEDWLEQLVNAFLSDVFGKKTFTFISILEGYLNNISSGADILAWREIVSSIQNHLMPTFVSTTQTRFALELIHRAHILIGDIAHRKQLQQRLKLEEQTDRLNYIIQSMSTIHEVDPLMELLAHELPGLGIQSCYLSLYEGIGTPAEWSRIIMASNAQGRLPIDVGGMLFLTKNLIPGNMLPRERRYAFDVEALFFKEEQIGFVMLELGSRDGDVYTALRGHISSTLKSAQLVQKIKEAEARAVKADQLKTRLLANVSHELRTPLNIIVGYSQSAMSSPNPYGTDLPKQLISDLAHIYHSGEHLIRLINDLLDTSRAEIGELDLWLEYVSIRPLLEETFASIANESSHVKKGIQWRLEIPRNLPVLQVDPSRLRQILLNLLSNAKKFTDSGHITLGAQVQVPHLHIWVEDSGSGIPVDQQERIFEPFITADKIDHRHEGIGLGLSITRRLVALHGGSLTLDSRSGYGSTFHVYLPLPNLNGHTIQVAEKDDLQPVLLCLSTIEKPGGAIEELCKHSNLTLLHITPKDDLNSLLHSVKPAALSWDLSHAMPADWSVIQTLRNHPQICQLPFLLFNLDDYEQPAASTQITDVLLKPVNQTTLLQMITSLSPMKSTGSILIVDDDLNTLDYYANLITTALPGYSVLSAQGGSVALELIHTNKPDLIILDLMMPEVDGFTVLTQIRSNPATTSIPVIILSGRVLSYEDVQKLNYPRVHYQTKGILSASETSDELQKVVNNSDPLPQHTSILVRSALAYLQENYSRAISLNEITEAIGVSKSYLSRIFHAEMGLSLWEYLKRYRVQKAVDLLVRTDNNITEVSAMVGFDDIGYFARVFHKAKGCSPREYRQRTRS
jgi:signal transduction histidine kinase/DNA-binding LacI/PurR family transcriptional regulator/AraC-like DNA-binding protein